MTFAFFFIFLVYSIVFYFLQLPFACVYFHLHLSLTCSFISKNSKFSNLPGQRLVDLPHVSSQLLLSA